MGRSIVFFLTAAALLLAMAAAQSCRTELQFNGASKRFDRCLSLPSQSASLAWTYFPDSRILDMAYSAVAPSASGWVGWGYNPQAPQMDGTTALIAFANSSGPFVEQYSITVANKGSAPLRPSTGSRDLRVLNKSVAITGTNFAFTAFLQLSSDQGGRVSHIWNRGASVNGDVPQAHTDFVNVGGSVNLLEGSGGTAGIPNLGKKNTHGILNAISWGILLPIGAMSARYLRPFEWADPAWFYIHATCQTAGYVIGVAGWATGLNLGSLSDGIVRHTHRNIGITIFVFGTLQVLALFLRPDKSHKMRKFWNVYHHSLGYTTIVLAIINIFKGLDILVPAKGWKRAYIGIIVALGVMSLVFEVITWVAYFLRKRASRLDKPQQQQQQRWEDSNPYAADRV